MLLRPDMNEGGLDTHDGYEHRQSEVVHQPYHDRRYVAYRRTLASEPAKDDARNEGTSAGAEADGDIFDPYRYGADESAYEYGETEKTYVARGGGTLGVAYLRDGFFDLFAWAYYGEYVPFHEPHVGVEAHVVAVALDVADGDGAHEGRHRKEVERLACILLGRDAHGDTDYGVGEQVGIVCLGAYEVVDAA